MQPGARYSTLKAASQWLVLPGNSLRWLASMSASASYNSRPGWKEKDLLKPVDQDVLAGIPWAGRSTLPWLMQKVATNGPRDQAIWRKLVARADVIAHSLTSKQVALTITALARAKYRDEGFLRRLCVKFLPSHVESAELLDFCGILSGLSQLDAYSEETFTLFAKRAAATVPQMDARQLSLVANAFARAGHKDQDLVARILVQVPRRLDRFTGRDVAVLLNALTQLTPDFGRGNRGKASFSQELPRELEEPLQAIALRLPEILPSADLHSLTLVLNAFAQLRFLQKDALDLLTEDLLSDKQRFQQMTPQQLAMVLNASAKLQLYEPQLLDALIGQIRIKARLLDAQGFCIVANAAAKLRLGVETFGALYSQVPRLLSRLSGRQVAMLCHSWAKAHVHNDDLFDLLALPLAQKAEGLTAHEVAIAVYGYCHFRKAPPDLMEPLLRRFGILMDSQVVSDMDLLMLGNALGRVGWRDERIAEALQDYSDRTASIENLSPQALATFSPTLSAQE